MKLALRSIFAALCLAVLATPAFADRPALFLSTVGCQNNTPPLGIIGVFGSCSAADSAAFSRIQSACNPLALGFTFCGSGCGPQNNGSAIFYASPSGQAGCGLWGGAVGFCPDGVEGYQFDNRVWCPTHGHDVERNLGVPDCPTCMAKGNPVFPAIFNKYEVATDYVGAGPFPLKFTRVYNSRDTGSGLSTSRIGRRWVHNYGMRIDYDATQPAPDFIRAIRADGKMIPFLGPSLNAPQDPTVSERLEVLPSGFKLTTKNDEVELYALNGKLLSITNREGLTQTLTYDGDGNLTTVTDPFGRTLTFTYGGPQGWIQTVTTPDGVLQYGYVSQAGAESLGSVTYPDGRTRSYLYAPPMGNVPTSNLLSGIVDEKGVQYASFTYQAASGGDSRVLSTQHAGGVGKVEFSLTSLTFGPEPVQITEFITPSTSVQRTHTYGNAGELSVLSSVAGQPCPSCGNPTNAFDANANLSSTTDWNGNRTNYTYDLTRNLETSRTEALTSTGATTPQTRTISTQWDPVFRLPTQIAEPLRITTNVYDPDGTQCGARGKLCSKTVQATTDASGALAFSATPTGTPRTWTYAYNSNGQVLTAKGPRTDVNDLTTYTYYPNDDTDVTRRGNLATITNALGQTTNITAYNAHGQPLTIVDPNGLTTTMTYDARWRLTSRTVGGETTSYDYDAAGQLTKVTLPDSSFLSYTYDDAHRVIAMQDNLGNRVAYTLDLMGNRTLEEVRDPLNALAQTRSRVYSAINRLIAENGANGQSTQYGYDNQGNVTVVTTVIPTGNQVTSNFYDALNRLKQVTDPASGNTLYAYNGLNALTQVTDPRSLSTSYSLDGLGNLNQQVSPDTGTTNNTYDTAGNLASQTDAKAQATSYTYDALNRVSLITFNDGSKQSYAYDQGPNALGRLSSIIETNSSNQTTSIIAYAYDQHGRVISETRTVAGVQYVLGYSYDSFGRLTGLTYPSGRTIAYGFDSLGRVNSVNTTMAGQTQSVVSNVTYQPFGGVNGFTMGNGQVYSRPYDTDGRVSSYTLGAQTFAINYDPANRIVQISDTGNAPNFSSYTYDALDRLTNATLPAGTFYNYSYDAVGNRTAKNISGSPETYTYSLTSNRIATLTPTSGPTRTFSFDNNGSTINDGQNGYVYDTRGRMVQAVSVVGTTSYQINALGQRIRKTNSTDDRVFHYDTKGKLIAETTPAGALLREYVYLGDIPIATLDTTSSPTSLLFGTSGASFTADSSSHQLNLNATGFPAVSATASSWSISSFGSWQFVYFSGKDAQNRQLSGEYASLNGTPQSAYVSLSIPPTRNENYNLSGTVGTDHFTGSDSSSGLSATMDVDEVAKTVTVTAGASPTVTYTIDPANWRTGTAGSYQTVNFSYASGDLTVAGGITRNSTNNFAFLQIRQGSSQSSSFSLNYQGAATQTRVGYIFTDHLNTPRLITDATQQARWRWDQQEPFGVNAPDENPAGQGAFEFPGRYPGQYADKETNLSYNYFRDFDPGLGRYTTSDPIGLGSGVNTFSYVLNDPLTLVDRKGLQSMMPYAFPFPPGQPSPRDVGCAFNPKLCEPALPSNAACFVSCVAIDVSVGYGTDMAIDAGIDAAAKHAGDLINKAACKVVATSVFALEAAHSVAKCYSICWTCGQKECPPFDFAAAGSPRLPTLPDARDIRQRASDARRPRVN